MSRTFFIDGTAPADQGAYSFTSTFTPAKGNFGALDTEVEIFDSNMVSLMLNHDTNGQCSQAVASVTAGQTYYIRVGGDTFQNPFMTMGYKLVVTQR